MHAVRPYVNSQDTSMPSLHPCVNLVLNKLMLYK